MIVGGGTLGAPARSGPFRSTPRVVAPGNSIGTLTVATASFNAGSSYAVEVDSSGASDLLQASGVVTISSGATVSVSPVNGTDDGSHLWGQYALHHRHRDGRGERDVRQRQRQLCLPAPELSYDANNVFLTLTQDSLFFRRRGRPRTRLRRVWVPMASAGHPVFDALVALATPAVPGALDSLSGEGFATQAGRAAARQRTVRDACSTGCSRRPMRRPARVRPSPISRRCRRAAAPTDLWGQSYGSLGSLAGNANAAAASSSAAGIVLGVDGLLGEWRVGALSTPAFRPAHRWPGQQLCEHGLLALGLYAGTAIDATRLDFGAALTRHDVQSTRSIALPE